MCNPDLDPKLQMREMGAQRPCVSFQAKKSGVRAPVLVRGSARLAKATALMMQKGPIHV